MAMDVDGHAVRGIVYWELLQAPKGLFMAAANTKNRGERDDAIRALTERIARRFDGYTITNERAEPGSPFAHIQTPPSKA